MKITTLMQGVALAMLLSTQAAAQEVVMRRPLPIKPGATVPSEQTDNPVVEDHPDPTLTTCDRDPSSPNAIMLKAQWIQTGWKTLPATEGQTCTTQQMGYACQATYVCQVDGENLTFTDLAPASACPNVPKEEGGCPPGYYYPPWEEGAQCEPIPQLPNLPTPM